MAGRETWRVQRLAWLTGMSLRRSSKSLQSSLNYQIKWRLCKIYMRWSNRNTTPWNEYTKRRYCGQTISEYPFPYTFCRGCARFLFVHYTTHTTYSLHLRPIKCLAQEHKCHDRNSKQFSDSASTNATRSLGKDTLNVKQFSVECPWIMILWFGTELF